MCGHGSNPGPGHPRPTAANAQTQTRDGVVPAHRRNAPHVWSILRVGRTTALQVCPGRRPEPTAAARTIPARLRYTSATSNWTFNWTSWNRPRRGGRGCGRSAGRQGAALMGRGRVDVVESLPAAERTTGGDRPIGSGQAWRPPCPQPRPCRSGTAFTTIVHRYPYCISIVRKIGNVCRHDATLNSGFFIVHVEKGVSRLTPRVEGVLLLSSGGETSGGGVVDYRAVGCD